jgi:hypothetical protein
MFFLLSSENISFQYTDSVVKLQDASSPLEKIRKNSKIPESGTEGIARKAFSVYNFGKVWKS